MVGSLWLFLCLGLLGSAGPAHFAFRLLAYRHQLDRGYAFAPGTEDGGWGYGWWLMRWGHSPLRDRSLDFFGSSAGAMGWLGLAGAVGTTALIALQP